jgi:heat shock protein HslJ
MNRLLPIVAFLLIAACDKQESDAVSPANEAAAAQAEPAAPLATTELPSLEGDWKVSTIGGRDVTGLAMTAAIGDGKASITTGCFRRAWTYTQNRNVVAFTAAPSGSSNCAGQPSADEEAAHSAISDANMAIFGKDGTEATLSGTGGMLTLQRR